MVILPGAVGKKVMQPVTAVRQPDRGGVQAVVDGQTAPVPLGCGYGPVHRVEPVQEPLVGVDGQGGAPCYAGLGGSTKIIY